MRTPSAVRFFPFSYLLGSSLRPPQPRRTPHRRPFGGCPLLQRDSPHPPWRLTPAPLDARGQRRPSGSPNRVADPIWTSPYPFACSCTTHSIVRMDYRCGRLRCGGSRLVSRVLSLELTTVGGPYPCFVPFTPDEHGDLKFGHQSSPDPFRKFDTNKIIHRYPESGL